MRKNVSVNEKLCLCFVNQYCFFVVVAILSFLTPRRIPVFKTQNKKKLFVYNTCQLVFFPSKCSVLLLDYICTSSTTGGVCCYLTIYVLQVLLVECVVT